MLGALLDDLLDHDHGTISPPLLCQRMRISLSELARLTRLHRNTLSRAPDSPRVQERLGEIVRILTKAAALSGDPQRAIAWFHYEPIAGLDYKTAEELVAEGRAAAVLEHLEDLVEGTYA